MSDDLAILRAYKAGYRRGRGMDQPDELTDRERLAADLRHQLWLMSVPDTYAFIADVLAHHLIALGWTRLDEERLAQAMHRAQCDLVWYTTAGDLSVRDDMQRHREDAAAIAAAAIARAYREDTE